MDSTQRTVKDLLEELNTLIQNNEKQDGSFAFDELKAKVVLDFAITEITRSIQK